MLIQVRPVAPQDLLDTGPDARPWVQDERSILCNRFFGSTTCRRNAWRPPRPGFPVARLSDVELPGRVRHARIGERFRGLLDTGSLDDHDEHHSRTDLARCGLLAFWTSGDPARTDQPRRRSALMRAK